MAAKMIHFAPTTGLNPRPATDYDLLAVKYYLRFKARKDVRDLESQLGRFGVESDGDLDFVFSDGKHLVTKCKII